MAQSGEALFQQMGCSTCHLPDGKGQGPALTNIFEAEVSLANGQTVTADENYLRESILNPQAKIVTGYSPIMPTFQGQINEEGVQQIVAYLKSLKTLKTQ
jgi:cytochrome c oxidase subunit 2